MNVRPAVQLTPHLRSRSPARRGQTLIEFALSFPIILVFFMGMLEIGWIEFNQTASLNAAREASRAGAVQSPGQGDNAQVTAIAQAGGYGLPITQVNIWVTTIAAPTVPLPDNTIRAPNHVVWVETVIQYQPLTPLFNFLPQAQINQLSATACFITNG